MPSPPFTTAQRASVRMYLGWSERFHQTDSRLEQALNASDMDVDAYNMVTGLLTNIGNVEAQITDCYNRMKAMKVGSIDLDAGRELGLLRSEGRRFVGRLASFLGVEVRHDVFSGSGPRYFSGYDGPTGGGGGGSLPPMG